MARYTDNQDLLRSFGKSRANVKIEDYAAAYEVDNLFQEAVKQGLNLGTGKRLRTIDSQEAIDYLKGKGTYDQIAPTLGLLTKAKSAGYVGEDLNAAYDFYSSYNQAKTQAQNAGIEVPEGTTFDQLSKLIIGGGESKMNSFNSASGDLKPGVSNLVGTDEQKSNTNTKTENKNDPNIDDPKNQYSTKTGKPNPAYDPNSTTSSGATTPTEVLSGPNLSQGSRGASVSQLQKILGVSTDGIFGPQTQAAVKAFQASHGLVADGIVGPKTMAALNASQSGPSSISTVAAGASSKTNTGPSTGAGTSTAPKMPSTGNATMDSLIEVFNNQSPQKSFSEVYKEAYKELGIDSMKESYEDETQEYEKLMNEKNDEAEDINNNPWLSEGVRVQKLQQLDKKYEGKETILSNKLKLLESNMSNARSEAQFVSGQVMEQAQQASKLNQDIIMKAIDIAEKEAEAEAALKKPIVIGKDSRLIDPSTGRTITTGGGGSGGSGGNDGTFTKTQINKAASVLGITPEKFNSLPYTEKNILLNTPEVINNPNPGEGETGGWFQIIDSVANGSEDFDTVFNEIKSADLSFTLRQALYARLVEAQKTRVETLPKYVFPWN